MNIPLVSDVTVDQIQEWKAKYGRHSVYQETIIINREPATDGKEEEVESVDFIIKVPPRSTVDAIADKQKANASISDINKILLANSVLAGDMSLVENNSMVYGSLLEAIRRLMKKPETISKKL